MLRLKTLVGEHPRGEGLFSRQSAIPGSGCTWQVKGASGLGTCTPLRKPGPLTSAVAACSREGQGRTCEKQAQAGSGHRTPSRSRTAGARARGWTPQGAERVLLQDWLGFAGSKDSVQPSSTLRQTGIGWEP